MAVTRNRSTVRKNAARYAAPLLAVAVLALLLSLLAGPSARCSTEDGVVEFKVFTSPDCTECAFLDDEMLPRLKNEYGDRIEYEYVDVTEFENFDSMLDMEKAYGRKEMLLPQVYLGTDSFIGEEEIEGDLEEAIGKYLAAGGADMPVVPEGDGQVKPADGEKDIYVTYFYTEGCRGCDTVSMMLDYMKRFAPNIKLREYDVSTERGMEMNEALCTIAGVPDSQRGITPSVFVGYRYLVGDDLDTESLQTAVEEASVEGTEDTWTQAEDQLGIAQMTIGDRLEKFTVFGVMGAGLLDGVNPCAFTVLVFFVSYLAFVGRKGREILLVGAAFTAAVFVTYFLIGLGLLSFLDAIRGAGRWVTLGVAILTLLFGVVSLYDYVQARRKGEGETTGGLPTGVTRSIHRVIREKTRARHFVVAAVAMGFLVSILELGCTGQVYLPTITYVAQTGGDRLRAILYLLAYNLMFVVPLLVVFVLAYSGTSSEKLVDFAKKHTNTLRLVAAIFFFALAAVLFVTL